MSQDQKDESDLRVAVTPASTLKHGTLPIRRRAAAEFHLGWIYYQGLGVPQDYAEAMRRYRKAAAQDHIGAQFHLGWMYHHGEGVAHDYAKAMRWYRKAAKQGNSPAQFVLGLMYYHGLGVPHDFVQAHMWFNLAAAQGNEDALENCDNLAGEMSSADVAKAQRMAREWPEQHSKAE